MGLEALESVLANLIDNARCHAGAGARVTVTLRAEGERAILRIADDGPGISPTNAGLIFAPFFTTARERNGTGLGLTIARGLVEAHGGSIALLPSERGAVFEIGLRRTRRAI